MKRLTALKLTVGSLLVASCGPETVSISAPRPNMAVRRKVQSQKSTSEGARFPLKRPDGSLPAHHWKSYKPKGRNKETVILPICTPDGCSPDVYGGPQPDDSVSSGNYLGFVWNDLNYTEVWDAAGNLQLQAIASGDSATDSWSITTSDGYTINVSLPFSSIPNEGSFVLDGSIVVNVSVSQGTYRIDDGMTWLQGAMSISGDTLSHTRTFGGSRSLLPIYLPCGQDRCLGNPWQQFTPFFPYPNPSPYCFDAMVKYGALKAAAIFAANTAISHLACGAVYGADPVAGILCYLEVESILHNLDEKLNFYNIQIKSACMGG